MKSLQTATIHARGLAAGYARGQAHIRKLNADRSRFEFMEKLFDAMCDQKILPTTTERGFIERIIAETNVEVPQIFWGDANICDSLQRKYQARLEQRAAVLPAGRSNFNQNCRQDAGSTLTGGASC